MSRILDLRFGVGFFFLLDRLLVKGASFALDTARQPLKVSLHTTQYTLHPYPYTCNPEPHNLHPTP